MVPVVFQIAVIFASIALSLRFAEAGRILSLPHRSFLQNTYRVKGDDKQVFIVRQVPGDGGCLFHAISAWLTFLQTNKHHDFDSNMFSLSRKLRQLAVDVLQQPNRTLIIENSEPMESTELLEMIAKKYDMEPSEYCTWILDPRTWGGGPEIVALSNHFKCPIHIYELSTERRSVLPFAKQCFSLEIKAKFGSNTFDDKTPLHILCCDGR